MTLGTVSEEALDDIIEMVRHSHTHFEIDTPESQSRFDSSREWNKTYNSILEWVIIESGPEQTGVLSLKQMVDLTDWIHARK